MMNTYDPQKAARVWQRVQSKQEIPQTQPVSRAEQLPALIMEAAQTAAVYLQLSRQMPSKQGAVLQRLAREEQAHVACLKGIYTLMTGNKPTAYVPQTEKTAVELTLRRCYGNEMRILKEYESRRDDPEYGPVFFRMAEQEREHCRALLELIGSMAKQ